MLMYFLYFFFVNISVTLSSHVVFVCFMSFSYMHNATYDNFTIRRLFHFLSECHMPSISSKVCFIPDCHHLRLVFMCIFGTPNLLGPFILLYILSANKTGIDASNIKFKKVWKCGSTLNFAWTLYFTNTIYNFCVTEYYINSVHDVCIYYSIHGYYLLFLWILLILSIVSLLCITTQILFLVYDTLFHSCLFYFLLGLGGIQ